MDDSAVKQIQLARAHRLVQWRGKTPRGRPIVSNLLDPRHKITIMGKAGELNRNRTGFDGPVSRQSHAATQVAPTGASRGKNRWSES
uniref:Uncharacterized protein n=1 Tax=Knipowitschia caucasica TaxID=637954 RepID=A0AAV2KGM6_KNICA